VESEPLEREDVVTIMESLMRAQSKLDLILGYLLRGDEEEED
jgi:hypothetical protein